MRHSQLIEDPCRLIHLRSAIWTVTWCSNSSLLVCVPRKTLKSKALSVVKSNFDFVFFWWLTVFYFLDQKEMERLVNLLDLNCVKLLVFGVKGKRQRTSAQCQGGTVPSHLFRWWSTDKLCKLTEKIHLSPGAGVVHRQHGDAGTSRVLAMFIFCYVKIHAYVLKFTYIYFPTENAFFFFRGREGKRND